MRKLIRIVAGLMLLLCSQFVNAQPLPPGPPCDPCAGMPWSADNFVTTTIYLSAPAGCPFKVYINYRTRICNGKLQIDCKFPGDVIIEDTTAGDSCNIACMQVPELMRKVYAHIQGLHGYAAIFRTLPSPCFYTGTITVPDAARVCFGMKPGSRLSVLMPCDPNGCCHSELIHVMTSDGPSFIQNVINSSTCPPFPIIPPTATIDWSCDILGGGSATFTVPFTPDSPLICKPACNPGVAKSDPTAIDILDIKTNISNLKIYPNPVEDILKISFTTTEENMPVRIEMFDVSGRTIVNMEHKTTIGNQQISVDMSAMPHGSYGIRLSYKSETITTKVAK
ncbi:MAG: T9SS type A sorting domain-containing protein [Sphingobacteriales bacterium]|nr:MAG: T9SS type A sorting domain-containing protein [Sphingobacteriales bacterium]